ncbi:MAG: TIGR02206 family membrane protein [Gammaproteobacteria bacterium]
MNNGFEPLASDHSMVLGLTVTIVVAMLLARRRFRTPADERYRYALASVLVLAEVTGWIGGIWQGTLIFPFNLCDLAAAATIWALLLPRHHKACLLAYFWGLAGSAHAIITPDLSVPVRSFWGAQFFLTHAGIVWGATYLAATGRVRPNWPSLVWVWLMSNLYALAAVLLNWGLGTNYGYLADKPSHPSLLDYLGPWPYYILGLEIVGIISLLFWYAPLAIVRARRQGPNPLDRSGSDSPN